MKIWPEIFISYHHPGPSWLGTESRMSPLTRKSRPFHCRYGMKSKNSPVTILERMSKPLDINLVLYSPDLRCFDAECLDGTIFSGPRNLEIGNAESWVSWWNEVFVSATMIIVRYEITHRLALAWDWSRRWPLPTKKNTTDLKLGLEISELHW